MRVDIDPFSDPSPATMAAVQAAALAVLARGPSAISQPHPATPPETAVRKRNVGKSKLSQAWGPHDIAPGEHSSASAALSATSPHDNPAQEPPAEVTVAPRSAEQNKNANGKKARPSSASICPICDEAAIHPRSQCPVVSAGPAPIRKRINQLKKAGRDEGLVEELQVLLKEVQKRRKTTAHTKPPPVEIPPVVIPPADGEVPPSSPDLPLISLSAMSLRRPSTPSRSISNSRLPAGSEISEVAVESKDEGSSNESTSSDDEDDAPAPAPSAPSNSAIVTNLEALIYGPAKPRGSVLTQISSSSDSEPSDGGDSDSDDEARGEADVDFDEEEKNDRAYRRMSRRFARGPSSSDDERDPQSEPDAADMDVVIPPTTMDPDSNSMEVS